VNSRTKPRSRRLRKKLRVAEFQEFGFEVSFALRPGLDEHCAREFGDAFIVDCIERGGLTYGGSDTHGFVTLLGRGSALDSHREHVLSWLRARTEVQSVEVWPLVDAWHVDEHEAALGSAPQSER